jgi:DNA-binding IclR family transcriptional regulator
MSERPPSPAVSHAVGILEYLAHTRPEASLTEIATDLSISKSSCLNILSTLISSSMLTRTGNPPRYRLGPRLIELGRAAQRNSSYRFYVQRELDSLLAKAKATCIIAQRLAGNDGFVVIDRMAPRLLDGEQTPPAAVGKVYPPFSPALGGAYLATLSGLEIAELVQVSSHSAHEYRILNRLPEIREKGFAWSIGEYLEDVNAIAVILPGSEPQLIICLVASSKNLRADQIDRWGAEMVAAVGRIADSAPSTSGLLRGPTG